MSQTIRQHVLRSPAFDWHEETVIVRLSAGDYFAQAFLTRQVRSSGHHLQRTPADEHVGPKHDGPNSLSDGDAATAP